MSTINSSKYSCTIYFLNELHPRYTCGICLNIVDEPVNCGSKGGCTGLFCTKCLSTSLSSNKSCPLCKFMIVGLPTKQNLIKEIIYDEHVYCMFSELTDDDNPSKRTKISSSSFHSMRAGCQWTGALMDLEAHLAHDCSLAPTPCTNKGCSAVIPRHDLAAHTENSCQFRKVPCPCCDSALSFNTLYAHRADCNKGTVICTHFTASYLREGQSEHDLICFQKPLPCPFALHGCTATLRRKDYEQHQIDSAVKHAELVAHEMSSIKKDFTDLKQLIASHFLTISKHCAANVQWKVKNVSEYINDCDEVCSGEVDLNDRAESSLDLHCVFTQTGHLGFFIESYHSVHNVAESLNIIGTTVTLQHPTDPTLHITHTLSDGNCIFDAPKRRLGWEEFTTDVRPYIHPDNSIILVLEIHYPFPKIDLLLVESYPE